jgi:hypothetical protein
MSTDDLPDHASEDDSEYDGFLSYAGEWHALAVGAFLAIVAAATMRAEVFVFAFLLLTGKAKVSNAHLRDAGKEVAYSGGAFVVVFGVARVAIAVA